MELLVIRHALAVERSPELPDTERPLTDRGRRRFRQVARGLRELGLRVDVVLSSPWRRAHETALLLEKLVVDRRAPVLSPLLAGPPKAELLSSIAGAGVRRLAVVGHEPWLGELIAMLVAGESRHGKVFPLKKGAVAMLDGEVAPGGMVVRGLLPPRVLRALA
ncbi:MAG TPA: phosphohistidine phosphatase SixA [Kofleriaceae bacterium]|nr:phosphohistidine phosphatase SixA [Kofleriaceae bacterium]